jgi:glycyl-tRNA synthetase beta chain
MPTGDKDPFGLRRAALGVLRILMETPLPLDLTELIADAAKAFPPGMLTATGRGTAADFMLDRLRGYLRMPAYARTPSKPCSGATPTRIDLVPAKLAAVREFLWLPKRWHWPRPTSGSATS